ncbi:MAG: ribonuclease H-like domain-containing protein [Ignavibacteriae bacterium]|nr:ribonuclease H-like domain-containing protein [Ignavibacteriota bacterium]
MSRVVFDIETLAFPLETFDPVQQEYLLKFADTEEKREAELQKLNLHALTAQIIAIGMLNPDTNAGKVFYQSAKHEQYASGDGKIEFISSDERSLLQNFWLAVQHYNRFITFNGRTFDCPFLMLRSALLGITPTRNLMPYRYDANVHCDLLDQFTFYGAIRKFNLDFYCKAFGLTSPKSSGITGLNLGPLFREGKFKEIAQYCLGDVIATTELFRRWDQYLNIKD